MAWILPLHQLILAFACFHLIKGQILADDYHIRTRRSSSEVPRLELTVSQSGIQEKMAQGSVYTYNVAIKHTTNSMAEARGVHVVWMLTPFVTFNNLTSSEKVSPQVQLVDDSVVFLFDQLFWMQKTSFSFSVEFDKNRRLQYGKHHVVTHVHFYYYKEYSTDQSGNVNKGVAFTQPLTTLRFIVEIPGCSSPLGMKSGKILDYQITASTSYPENRPTQAREDKDAWCAHQSNAQQFIQVDFPYDTIITLITTYGRRTKYEWTTSYSLQYSHDENTWYDYVENGFVKTFQGNYDRFTPKTHWLREPIRTYHLRIRPLTWNKDLVCMRFELNGCAVPGSSKKCIVPLGLENGEIPDEALSSSSTAPQSDPTNARLNKNVTDFPYGWLAEIATNDWLQIDFGSIKIVTGIATQGAYIDEGGHNRAYYLKKYKLAYSNNSIEWKKYSIDGVEQELIGPRDDMYALIANQVKVQPFVARYLRITPTDFTGLCVMRAEIYGCSGEDFPPTFDNLEQVPYARRSFLLDPISDNFFVCMYTSKRDESSCLSTPDGKEWNSIDPRVISIVASNPAEKHIYGLSRDMNLMRSADRGLSWKFISTEYYKKAKRREKLFVSSAIPDNMTSASPSGEFSVVSSTGTKWGVSGSGIYIMSAGTSTWSFVGSWRCCGL